MSLSDEKIFDLIYNILIKHYSMEKSLSNISYLFDDFIMSFFSKITLSNIFKNWNGIESSSTIILIMLSQEYISNNKKIFNLSIFPEKISENIIKEIYTNILNEYKNCCENFGLKFVPNIKGLETTIKKRNEKKQ